MIRSIHALTAVILAMALATHAWCQEPMQEPSQFQPAPDAEIVTLDQPRHRIALPAHAPGVAPEASPRGPDRSFPLDPAWHVARVAITEDGQIAYLLVFDTHQKEQAERYLNAEVSIRRISLDTGEETARYDFPAPFASTQYPSAWGNGDAGLTVSASGQSLIAAFLPFALITTNQADQKYKQAMTFFRWDTQTKELTHERLLQPGAGQWKMLPGDDRMIVWKPGQDTSQIECWDTSDLSATPRVQFPFSPAGQPRRDGTIRIWRQCTAYDHANKTLNMMLHWRRRPAEDRPFAWEDWFRQFDTQTGQPIGPGTKFRNVHSLMPVALNGDHLLLREEDRSGLDHRQTAHVWNIRNREHVAAIDVTPISKSYDHRVDLTPDGSAVIYENRLLDLHTFTWTPARADTGTGVFSAITPDGRHVIQAPGPSRLRAHDGAQLNVYDLK